MMPKKLTGAEVLDRNLSERDLLAQVRQLALVCDWLVYHTHDSRRSPAGFPDLVLVRSERLIFAELKKEKGRVTPDQKRWLDALEACQVAPGPEMLPGDHWLPEVYIWRPSNWAEIVEVLR